MLEEDVVSYLKYAIDNRLPLKLMWVTSVLSVTLENTSYIRIKDKSLEVLVNDEWLQYKGAKVGTPLLDITQKIHIPANFMVNVKEDLETTVGRVLFNYVVLAYPFGSKVPFINKRFTPDDIEEVYIANLLQDDPKEHELSVPEYINFVDACTYIQNWADIIVYSSTEKSILPPPGIKEYKAKLIKEAKDKYGPDAMKDQAVIVDIETKMKEYDREFLKDDPSLDRLASGKILNNSRKKLYLSIGVEKGMGAGSDKTNMIEHSFLDGYGDNPEDLASIFNSVRNASYQRGAETANGGLGAKILLRATSAIEVKGPDCKTKIGKHWDVTNKNNSALVGRYVMNGDKVTLVEDLEASKAYIGKSIEVRSPLYCKNNDGETFCSICGGVGLSSNPSSVSLVISSMGGTILYISMAAMHDVTISSSRLDLDEALS